MAETKTCPKCNGAMTQGRIMKRNEYTSRVYYEYVFAPNENDSQASKTRKSLVAYTCSQCGFTEFYTQPLV